MRITKNNTSGLIIDIQERLYPAMAEKELFLKNSKMLIEGLAVLKLPTTFTQQYSKGLGNTLEEIRSLQEEFTYIEKTDFSCHDVEEYASYLKNNSIRNVIICGIEAHVCVLQTAVDLKEAGYNPIVIVDATSSRDLANKALALERFRQEGIMISSTESILFELTRSAKAEEFKSISKIVK